VSSARTPASVPPPTRQDTAKAGGREASATRARDIVQNSASTNETAARPKAFSDAASGAAALAAPASPAAPAVAESAPLQRSAAESAAVAGSSEAMRRSTAAPLAAAKAPAMMLDTRRLPTLIVSSNPDIRWRIVANGAVQHSTDSGSTWEMQATGVTVMLAAGASPSPSICWLVGPDGIVLLSTDGRSWRRIAFPEAADLASVRAMDDKSATVGTTDGRAFSTTDGGQTWTRSPAW
jgi:photosynthesis system II assembly factor YCF48-like protein